MRSTIARNAAPDQNQAEECERGLVHALAHLAPEQLHHRCRRAGGAAANDVGEGPVVVEAEDREFGVGLREAVVEGVGVGVAEEQQGADHLDATAGRPGAGDETGEEQHPQRRKDRPQGVIDAGIAGGGGDRGAPTSGPR